VTIDAGLAPPATVGTALSSFIDGLRGPDFRKTLGDLPAPCCFADR